MAGEGFIHGAMPLGLKKAKMILGGYNDQELIYRSQFCKEPLPDRSFTFWDWFHAVMKLTKEDLRSLWIDGSVYR